MWFEKVEGSRHATFRVDEDGFIEPGKVHEDADIGICFLGGSTTACMALGEKERFPYLVGQKLEQRWGKTVNSFNGGRSGNDTAHSLNRLLNVVIPTRPDVVVLMHNINDLNTLLYSDSYWENQPPSREKVAYFKNRHVQLGSYLQDPVWMLPRIRYRIRRVFGKDTTSSDEWAAQRDSVLQIDRSRILRDYRSAIVSFVVLCRAWEIEPVLMTQANRITEVPRQKSPGLGKELKRLSEKGVEYPEFQALYTQFNEINREVAGEHGILLIDLDRRIPRDATHIEDLVHLTSAGSARVSSEIADSLGSNLLSGKGRN